MDIDIIEIYVVAFGSIVDFSIDMRSSSEEKKIYTQKKKKKFITVILIDHYQPTRKTKWMN